MDWITTVPKGITWKSFSDRLLKVSHKTLALYLPVTMPPEEMELKDRMFILFKGKIRGWIEINYFGWMRRFHCKVTGIHYPEGFYVQISGKFHVIDGAKMRGFKGIKKAVTVDSVMKPLKKVYEINGKNIGLKKKD